MKLIFVPIFVCLCLNLVVLAPPSLYINYNRSQENVAMVTPPPLTSHSNMASRPPAVAMNRTQPVINHSHFDLNSYRSSWKFVDKKTIRVRFRLVEHFLRGVHSIHFVTRHIHTGYTRTYDQAHENINLTFTVYLHNLKHGRHTVCLLLYSLKSMRNPQHIFCLDVIYNFHKYRYHDADSDDHKDTVFFLLTQYTIVCGILCILQIVHTTRKRRILRAFYEKANALRHAMMEHHHRPHEPKCTADLAHPKHAIDYLIYNLDREALYNFDRAYMHATNVENASVSTDSPDMAPKKRAKKTYLKLPSRTIENTTPLLDSRRSVAKHFDTIESDDEIATVPSFDESGCDTRSYEDRSISFKSLSHILEGSKPWMTKLADDGSVKHSLLSSTEPLSSTNRVQNL